MADEKTPGQSPDPTPAQPNASPLTQDSTTKTPVPVQIVNPGPVPGQPAPIAEGLDETVPGGRYRTQSGDWVDANGEPIKEAKKR